MSRMRHVVQVLVTALFLLLPSTAHSLCIYKGKMYAKTTLAEEFRDSQWVVRAIVIAADDHWSDEDESWTLYHLQVRTAYKGKPPLRIDVFTYRDSGGFFLDKGTSNDLGSDYLLFLNRLSPKEQVPLQARHAAEVNYSCGQSKEWTHVVPTRVAGLEHLARGKQQSYKPPLPTDASSVSPAR